MNAIGETALENRGKPYIFTCYRCKANFESKKNIEK